jgi:hypothetical protein
MPRSVEASPAGQGGKALWTNRKQSLLIPEGSTEERGPLLPT